MVAVHQIGAYRVTDRVLDAVREASDKTGVDFAYMVAKAARESGFDTDVRAATSSATGLYQFIDQTWLDMVKTHGAAHGLGRYADQIEQRADGRLTVADPDRRREILNLRTDPRLNALMAGEYAADNKSHLQRTVGGEIGPSELYLAHFLGAGGAETFLKALRADPEAPAASLLPQAAAANRAVFYENGQPRSLRAVYDRFANSVRRDMAMAGDLPMDGAAANEPTASRRFPTPFGTTLPRNAGAIGTEPTSSVAALGLSGNRQLSLWTVLTLSSLPVPGRGEQDGISDAKMQQAPGVLFG